MLHALYIVCICKSFSQRKIVWKNVSLEWNPMPERSFCSHDAYCNSCVIVATLIFSGASHGRLGEQAMLLNDMRKITGGPFLMPF